MLLCARAWTAPSPWALITTLWGEAVTGPPCPPAWLAQPQKMPSAKLLLSSCPGEGNPSIMPSGYQNGPSTTCHRISQASESLGLLRGHGLGLGTLPTSPCYHCPKARRQGQDSAGRHRLQRHEMEARKVSALPKGPGSFCFPHPTPQPRYQRHSLGHTTPWPSLLHCEQWCHHLLGRGHVTGCVAAGAAGHRAGQGSQQKPTWQQPRWVAPLNPPPHPQTLYSKMGSRAGAWAAASLHICPQDLGATIPGVPEGTRVKETGGHTG